MLTKPFVFVVQVVATIFGTEAAEYKSVLTDPSHGWKELHGIEIPLRGHRCLIEEAALSLVPTPTHAPTSVTSATSDLPTAIRSHVPPSNFSGPGSGTQGEMLTKPFVFVVQVVATIFGTEAAEYKSVLTDPSHGWKELHGIEIPLRGHRCLIEEAALSLVPTPTHAPTSCERSVFRIPLVRRPLGTDNQHARIATKSTQMTMKMTHSVLTQTKPKKLRSQGTNTSSGSCLEKASQERAERNCLPDSEVMRPRINQFESSHHQAGACRCRTQCTIYMV
ncbi:hypothetical protein MRX96_042715 [Rhipicephalus microplus]